MGFDFGIIVMYIKCIMIRFWKQKWLKIEIRQLRQKFMLYIASCLLQWWLNVMLYYRHMRTYAQIPKHTYTRLHHTVSIGYP